MSMTPSSPNRVNSLPAKGVYEVDLDSFRTEAGTCDNFKVSEDVALKAYEEPQEFANEILPSYVAKNSLGFIFSQMTEIKRGRIGKSYEIRGHVEAKNIARRYKLDNDASESTSNNSRILDEVVMKVKLPSALKKRAMGLLGREALAKVSYSQSDGINPFMLRSMLNLTEDVEISDQETEFENDQEYVRLRSQNELMNSLRKDLKPDAKSFRVDPNLKDMDIVPVAPDKNWTKDVYAFLRESDRSNPLSLLRADWDENNEGFMYNQEQATVFNQLAGEMDKEVVDKFIYGDDIFVQLANEMDESDVRKFSHLRHNDKFMKDAPRPDDEPEEFSLV